MGAPRQRLCPSRWMLGAALTSRSATYPQAQRCTRTDRFCAPSRRTRCIADSCPAERVREGAWGLQVGSGYCLQAEGLTIADVMTHDQSEAVAGMHRDSVLLWAMLIAVGAIPLNFIVLLVFDISFVGFTIFTLIALGQLVCGIIAVVRGVRHRAKYGRGGIAPAIVGGLAALGAPLEWLGWVMLAKLAALAGLA